MTSHELARLLLARRDNDVYLQVLIDDDPSGQTYSARTVRLQCDDDLLDPDLRAAPVVTYDSQRDGVVIAAGSVALTDPEADE